MDKPQEGYFIFANRQWPRRTWYKDAALRRSYLCLMFVIMTSVVNGFNSSMVHALQAMVAWRRSLVNSIMGIGSLFASPLAPHVADSLGRRNGIVIGSVIIVAGAILQAISTNVYVFAVARFTLGFGITIAQNASPLLLTEIAHPQDRASLTTVYNTTWYLGGVAAAIVAKYTYAVHTERAWRIPSGAQAVMPLLQIILIWSVPESPRWYVDKGKDDKALETLIKVHGTSNRKNELVKVEFKLIKETLKLEKLHPVTWSDLWATKGNRHRLLILISAGLFSQWSGTGLVTHYIISLFDAIGSLNDRTMLNIYGGLHVLNFLLAVLMCFFVDELGRRPLFLMSAFGMLCTFLVWTVCAERQTTMMAQAVGNATVAIIFILYMFYNIAWSGLYVSYSVEILPYSIRAKGMTILFLFVNLGVVASQYVNPLALDKIQWRYFLVFVSILVIELIVIYKFYKETRNTSLEEIARYFDGDSAAAAGGAHVMIGGNFGVHGGVEFKGFHAPEME